MYFAHPCLWINKREALRTHYIVLELGWEKYEISKKKFLRLFCFVHDIHDILLPSSTVNTRMPPAKCTKKRIYRLASLCEFPLYVKQTLTPAHKESQFFHLHAFKHRHLAQFYIAIKTF